MRTARMIRGASAAAGPLLFVRAGSRVALGEWVTVAVPDQPDRQGQVIDAGDEIAVVQVLEDTLGLVPSAAAITLTGTPAEAIVGRELLGRTFDGLGRPLDGARPPIGTALRPIAGAPMNPQRRVAPKEFIETGFSAIDGLNTLVRGQKLPIFSGPGLPALELAARIVEWARVPGGESFAVIFVGIGITDREADGFMRRFLDAPIMRRTILYINRARDATLERLLAPRIALTQAEHLAFDEGYHVLVILADMLHYCDALREIAAAREEIPARFGYPGYMYTDLASIFERAGVIDGARGSITQLPLVTMPHDDITHPIPDLTGYITEGQIVLSRELHQRGVFPPIDVLPSLSRLMKSAIGDRRTVAHHREWSDQLYATYAQGREARFTAAIVGEAGLDDDDRAALAFARDFEERLVRQDRRRTIADTIDAGWALLDGLPAHALHRISEETLAQRQRLRASVVPQ